VLCRLDHLPDPGGRAFSVEGRRPFFVVRRGGEAFGYLNRCPHAGTPLDWNPGTFLSWDKTEIQCSTHGAAFRIEDGLCIYGPCAGRSLQAVAVRVEDGVVRLADDPGTAPPGAS